MLNASFYLGHVVASRFGLTFLNFWKAHKWQMCLWCDPNILGKARDSVPVLCLKTFQSARCHISCNTGLILAEHRGSNWDSHWQLKCFTRFGYPFFLPREDSSKDMYGHFTCKTLTHLKTTLSTRLRKKLTNIPEPATWLYPLMRRYTLAHN